MFDNRVTIARGGEVSAILIRISRRSLSNESAQHEVEKVFSHSMEKM